MGLVGENIDLRALLTPTAFKRENFSSFLYSPYSLKLHRRVYFYRHHGYDLWVRLEGDLSVIHFNERVPPVPVAFEDGRASLLAPAVVSKHEGGAVVVHTFQRSSDAEDGTEDDYYIAWKNWCDMHGFQHREWSAEQLQGNPIELANLKRLLRFVSYPGYVQNEELEKAILAELHNVRKTILANLIRQFPVSDPDEVRQSLCRMILVRKIFSDIHLSPLSMITEVSAYHEFTSN